MKYTDKFRGRYKTSAESRTPGYLSQRMKIYARRERMRAAKQRKNEAEVAQKVTAIPTKKREAKTT